MNDIQTWMVNLAGGCKKVSTPMVEELLAKGWQILPQNMLTSTGSPKQMYLPQYDQQSPQREKRIDGMENGIKDMLPVECF